MFGDCQLTHFPDCQLALSPQSAKNLIFQGKGALMHICSIEPEMVCICADMGENLIPALYWYRAQGDRHTALGCRRALIFLASAAYWHAIT